MTADQRHGTGRRIRVVWNPASGRKGGLPTNRASHEMLLELMARHGLGDELVETGSEGEAIEAARDAAGDDYDIVVGAGGDGTIALAGFQLLGTRTALGAFPLGTIMNIPRMLGIPRDLEEAVRVVSEGHVRTIDLGQVGARTFFEAGSVGIHAAVSREMPKVDEGDYGAILRSIVAAFRYRPSRILIEMDGERRLETRALLVAVANGPFMGAGFRVAPDARLDDGLFDVRVFQHYSKRELMRHLASIAFGRRSYEPRALTERAAHVRISSRHPLQARADAEDLGTTPVTFEIRPRILNVVAPEPSTSESATGTSRMADAEVYARYPDRHCNGERDGQRCDPRPTAPQPPRDERERHVDDEGAHGVAAVVRRAASEAPR
jgi:diacylglycerol kinase (ATP)